MNEKRRHFRKPLRLKVEFSVGEEAARAGVCKDLSLGGMSIESETPAAFGDKVTLHVPTELSPRPLVLEGVVRWNKGPVMGVQFGLMGARQTYLLTELLSG